MGDTGTNRLYALLIGIDCYLPNQLPDGSRYSSLGGCVRDITHVENFLRSKLNVPQERILKLTSTNRDEKEPPEPKDTWPTYETIVAAFHQIREMAQPGDQVYIHYSGHGGRTRTKFPNLKGRGGLDETLVPMDIGRSTARYLRDIELAHLLKKMMEKGLLVTIVLDSCHSGGATRGGGGARIRGLKSIDTTPRPLQSLVASDEELAATWGSLTTGVTRNLQLGSGWLPDPKGFVLLAACRAHELSREFPFDGEESNGALTYWLLEGLKQIGPDLSYKTLHDRVVAKVHSQFPDQTPQLEGEGNRIVFARDKAVSLFAVNVMDVDMKGQRILLNTGQAHGVRKGAQFAVYPQGAQNFGEISQRLALVEISELRATDSWARIIQPLRQDAIEPGAQAVLLDPGDISLRRTVRLVYQDEEVVPRKIAQKQALKQIEEALQADTSGFVALAAEKEAAHYQVAVNANGEFEIWDSSGQEVANLRPALKIGDRGGAARVVQRLVHLTKYQNISQLDNFDPMSPLRGKLVVELIGVQNDYVPGDRPSPKPFDDPGNTPVLKPGQWTFLLVRNNSSQVLNITVLDLQPDWGITQVYPADAGAFETLEPGRELPPLRLRAALPADYTAGTDVIKVFATLGPTNFRWLELPPLDQPLPPKRITRGGTANPLETLLAAVVATKPRTRNLAPAANPSGEWVTKQVEVQVQV